MAESTTQDVPPKITAPEIAPDTAVAAPELPSTSDQDVTMTGQDDATSKPPSKPIDGTMVCLQCCLQTLRFTLTLTLLSLPSGPPPLQNPAGFLAVHLFAPQQNHTSHPFWFSSSSQTITATLINHHNQKQSCLSTTTTTPWPARPLLAQLLLPPCPVPLHPLPLLLTQLPLALSSSSTIPLTTAVFPPIRSSLPPPLLLLLLLPPTESIPTAPRPQPPPRLPPPRVLQPRLQLAPRLPSPPTDLLLPTTI